jgi:uncharacterized protein (TIGR00297 family)
VLYSEAFTTERIAEKMAGEILLIVHSPLTLAMTLPPPHPPLLSALVITLVFALAGYWLRGVTRSGALTGFALAFALYACAGPRAFAALVALFLVTLLATRLGRQRKLMLGTAERPNGRGASQVLANVGVCSLFAIGYGYFGKSSLLLPCAAALAEAAADTISSECGQAFSAPARLLSTWAPVVPGTNGAISSAGTGCGALAALGMGLVAVWTGLVPASEGWIVALAALAGMFFDSLLGALWERPGGLNNDAVNLLGTLFAAIFALCLAFLT